MKKIQYIIGNREYESEIREYFVSKVGKKAERVSYYGYPYTAYFVNPKYNDIISSYDTNSWEFKAFVEAGVFEELKYPYTKQKLQVIQGVSDRGDEVIALLESLGGKNFYRFEGRLDNVYYFIDSDGCIYIEGMTNSFFDKYELEILTLPEKVEKPKLKVIKGVDGKGDEVIELLVSLGGINDGIWFGNGDDGYYFIGDDGHIKYDGIDSTYFDKFELEILSLPEEKAEKPKLKVIRGDRRRGDEVIALLESLGGLNLGRHKGDEPLCYYFIDPRTTDKTITYYRYESTFFNDFDLDIITLPEITEKQKLKVIQGDMDRGDEVIAILESLGGRNTMPSYGRLADKYYYINQAGAIDYKSKSHAFFDNYELEVLTLPNPKLNVVQGIPDRGPEVVALLESLGGVNKYHLWCEGTKSYYYIDSNKTIRQRYMDDKFFENYELEILTLPDKESPKPCDESVCTVCVRPNKDSMILEPFVTKVLVRTKEATKWLPGIYVCKKEIDDDTYYIIAGSWCKFKECIPYEGNEDLILTTKDAG